MQHDRASGHLHIAHGSPLPVLLVRDDDAVLPDAPVRLDAAFECVLPNVREHISVGLKLSVDSREITESRVSHRYFFLNTNTGSDLKALLGVICFSPTIIES